MRKKLIVLTTILGLIAFSGVAAAAEETEPEDTGDTTFNFGYDEDNGVFIWGSSPSDGQTDCSLDDGPLQVTYGSQNGGLLIDDLEGLETEDCPLTAGKVAGPQGQVNHGMFLKTFNAMFDGQARGCMVRHIAQSDLGKGDQQVEEGTEGTEAVTGEVDFETVMTDCVHGPDDDVEGESNGKGRPAWVTEKIEKKLADKAANGEDGEDDDEELESDDSARRGPPDHARGKGPKG